MRFYIKGVLVILKYLIFRTFDKSKKSEATMSSDTPKSKTIWD